MPSKTTGGKRVIMEKRITLAKIRREADMNINDELLWFGQSLGLFGKRDKDKSCYRIFVELLKNKQGLTSDELGIRLKLTRATVIHHIKKLIKSGLVIKEQKKYFLRVESLRELIDEVESDINNILRELKKSADRIDKVL